MRNFLYLVAVAFVAGVLEVEYDIFRNYGIFRNEEQLIPVMEPPSEPQPEYDTIQAEYDTTPEISQETEPQPVNPSPGLESNNLSERYKLALKIFSPSERDSALQGLVNEALKEGDSSFAIKIAGSIFYPSTRDRAYTQIIDQALLKSDLKTAEIAAEKIWSPSKRDSQLRKILRVSD